MPSITHAVGEGSAEDVRLDALEAVHATEASVDVSITTPAVIQALTGSFTAKRTTVTVDIDISHHTHEHLGGHVGWWFFYGPDGADLSIDTEAELSSLGAGVVKKRIGTVSAYAGSTHRTLVLTGLTVGAVYDYSVSCAVVGGFAQIALGKQPIGIAVSQTETAALDSALSVVTRNTDGTASVLKARHEFGFTDTVAGTVTLTSGGSSGNVALTPDGVRALISNLTPDTVSVVTTGLVTGAAPAQQAAYSTGASSDPFAVVCERHNSTHGWVGMLATGTVRRVTLADGTLGTAYSLDAPDNATTGMGMAINAAGTVLYAVSQTEGKVYKVQTSDGAILASAAITGGVWDLAITPDDSTLFVICRTSEDIVPVATSDLALGTRVVPTRNPYSIDVFPDQRALVTSSDEAGDEMEQFSISGTGAATVLTNYVDFDNPGGAAYDVAISPKGAIYSSNFTGSTVNLWPGGKVVVDTGSDFYLGELSVVVRGAT